MECVSGGVLLTQHLQPQLGLYILTSGYYYYYLYVGTVCSQVQVQLLESERKTKRPKTVQLVCGTLLGTSRDEFDMQQQQWRQRFERGEGAGPGGVQVLRK